MDDTTTAAAKQTIARVFRAALSLADAGLVDRFIAYTCQDMTEGWPADWSDTEIRAEFADWLAAFGSNAPAGELAARIETVRGTIERLKFDRDRAKLWKQAATVATLAPRIAALELELRRLTGATPVRAYVGQTRAGGLMRELEAAGLGECTTRGQLPNRRGPWFYDNGAFEDWRSGEPFDYLQFSRDMRAIRLWQDSEGIPLHRPRGGQRLEAPDFIVLPDLVAQGPASLEFSAEHLDDCRPTGAPLYVAVQDGMTADQVARFVRRWHLDGLFVGGSLPWKLETGAAWCALGRELTIPVHVGRVGTFDRVLWAREIGAASIDSSLPLWSDAKLETFLEAMRTAQAENSRQGLLEF